VEVEVEVEERCRCFISRAVTMRVPRHCIAKRSTHLKGPCSQAGCHGPPFSL
jgi:hypothetical protein